MFYCQKKPHVITILDMHLKFHKCCNIIYWAKSGDWRACELIVERRFGEGGWKRQTHPEVDHGVKKKSMANVFSHSNCYGQIRSWYWIFIWRFSQCIDRDTFQLLIKFCNVLFYWDRNSVIIVFFKVLSRIDIGTYQCINKHVPGIDISVVESSSFFSPYQFHVG